MTSVIFNPDAKSALTYNLTVADYHTYFVGEDGVLVHDGGKFNTQWAGIFKDQKLKNIMDDIMKRELELENDAYGLSEYGSGPNYTTRQGRRRIVKKLWNDFYRRLDKISKGK